ncbi:glycosyltransferase family 2 protein [Albibacterium indicum]|uniref:glycosyltransferase family 2 protein n=1 Tax=Albibacterium indicum TaxID=2292082 RepID=UPI000E4F8335|nr:glycosyltransferase [Pedobacter indicus]
MKSSTPLVSIIVPVYNAEETLHSTLASLKAQTYKRLELIFVDDCSTDGSSIILNKFLSEYDKGQFFGIQLVRHFENSGVATARNTGLDQAQGDYIYFVDADDWIEPNTVELLVEEAVQSMADIVGFNWFLSFKENEREMRQPEFSSAQEAVEWMMMGKMRWNLWLFFVKRSLYEDHAVRFLEGMNMGEDMLVMIKLFVYARKVHHVDSALYHYGRSNSDSLTNVYSSRHIEEVTQNVRELEAFLSDSKFGVESKSLINDLKLNIKLPLLISDKKAQYRRWASWFPEVNHLATANKGLSWRIRVLQWAAASKNYWLIRLHYHLIIRMVYGVIYK